MMATVPRQSGQHGASSRVVAALFVSLVAVGCKAFDPVKSTDLCGQQDVISANCPQCQGDTPEANCPQCQEGDPSRCRPVTRDQPLEPDPDGNGIAGGPDGSEQAGEAGNPDVSTGGSSGQEGASGSDGGSDSRQAAGQGGKAPPPDPSAEELEDQTPGCQSDSECMRKTPEVPYCEPMFLKCEQCVTDEHCAGTMLGHCDPTSHRCADCVSDSNCDSMACDQTQHICVDCKTNEQCPADAVENQCNPDQFKCVDCMDDSGCSDSSPACDSTMNLCFPCLEGMGEQYCPDEVERTCDPATRECVDCIDDSGCSREDIYETCDRQNKVCVDCYEGKGCLDSAKPVCDGETCVECLENSQCDTGHCFEKHCVECEGDDDCTSRSESRCSSSSHTCEPCGEDSHCEHLDGTTECDSGRCVECKDDSGGACGDYACLRDEKTCSDVRKGSVDVCRDCIADSVCKEGMKCVPLSYGSRSLGDFCVYAASSGGCGSRRPYSRSVRATSIDDHNANYCVPATTTTCEAVVDATRANGGVGCSGDADCGADGIEDGNCNEDFHCTYGCDTDNDCAPGLSCLMNNNCG